MFARQITIRLKQNVLPEFNRTMNTEILPLLRKQKGFLHEVTLLHANGGEGIGISLWDNKENAELYNTSTYPQVMKSLEKFVDGTPQLRTFDAATSTIELAIPVTA